MYTSLRINRSQHAFGFLGTFKSRHHDIALMSMYIRLFIYEKFHFQSLWIPINACDVITPLCWGYKATSHCFCTRLWSAMWHNSDNCIYVWSYWPPREGAMIIMTSLCMRSYCQSRTKINKVMTWTYRSLSPYHPAHSRRHLSAPSASWRCPPARSAADCQEKGEEEGKKTHMSNT